MPSGPMFTKLNADWSADPNAPIPEAWHDGADLLLKFHLNAFQFPQFKLWEKGILRFLRCSRYRLGYPNMDGWYFGHCRYGKLAHEWGEFYELSGDDASANPPTDWQIIDPNLRPSAHFLFYFRDETFECFADAWQFEPDPANALYRNFLDRRQGLATSSDPANDPSGIRGRAIASPDDELIRPHQDHPGLVSGSTVGIAVANHLQRHVQGAGRLLKRLYGRFINIKRE